MPVLRAALVLSSVLALTGCADDVAATTSPRCEATRTTLRGTVTGSTGDLALVVVVDPHLATGTIDHEALVSTLVSTLRFLITADWDLDGHVDSTPFSSLRLAVLDASGTEHTSIPSPVPPVPRGASPVLDGGIEVWPGDPAWDGWFADTARARINDALGASVPPVPLLSRAAGGFLTRHADFVGVDGTHDLALIVLTDRDESANDLMRLSPWMGHGVALIGAIREADLGYVASGDFRGLSELRTFDSENVRCADGRVAGAFPRSLLSTVARAAAAGWSAGGASVCAPMTVRDAILQSLSNRSGTRDLRLCMPRPLSTESDGLVACSMSVLLPPFGSRRLCADFGLARIDVESGSDGVRERCEVPQLPRANIGDGRIGFYYDDFTPDLYDSCSMASPQALSTSAYTNWPPGTEAEATCFAGSTACGFELPDAGSNDASR